MFDLVRFSLQDFGFDYFGKIKRQIQTNHLDWFFEVLAHDWFWTNQKAPFSIVDRFSLHWLMLLLISKLNLIYSKMDSNLLSLKSMNSEYLMRFPFHISYPCCHYGYCGLYKPLSMPEYLPLAQLVLPLAHQWMPGAGDIHIFPKNLFNSQINFGGSSKQSHFIFVINVGMSRIRHRTNLNLNDNRFWVDLEIHHSIAESLYVGSDSFRHWFQKYNGFGLNYP